MPQPTIATPSSRLLLSMMHHTSSISSLRPMTVPSIERIECYILRVPLARPIADSIYRRTHWHVPVVEVTTSEGLTGTGYSGLWTGEDLLVQTIETEIAPQVIGRDPREIHRLWSEVYWSPLHWVGRAGIAHMAQGMVDIALWDLAAKRAGQPLWRLLGGRHPVLGTYNTDGGWLNFSERELIDDMCGIVDRGWTKVKMKVGGPASTRTCGALRACAMRSATRSSSWSTSTSAGT